MQRDPLRYTARDAQHALSIGNTKFWQLVAAGKLRVHRDGPRVYVTLAELKRYIEERESTKLEAA